MSSVEAQVHRRPESGRAVRLRWLLGAAALVVVLVAPLYLEESYLRIGLSIAVGAVGAMGLTMLLGHAGQLSLAHGFFLLVGATTYTVLSAPEVDGLVSFGLPPVIAAAGAIAVSALLGIAFAPVAGRVRGIYLGIASLGLIFIGLYLGQRFHELTGGTSTGRPVEPFSLLGFSFSNEGDLTVAGVPFGRTERLWYLFAVVLLVAYLLARGALASRPGRSWRAVRDSEAAAQSMGIDVMRTKATAFAVSSAYAGVAGVMTVLSLTLLKPDESEYGTYGINATIAVLAMVIIGGVGSLGGAIVGAVIVAGLPLYLSLTMSGGAGGSSAGDFTPVIITQFVYGGAVVLIVLLEPRGLAGVADRVRAAVVSRASRVSRDDTPHVPTSVGSNTGRSADRPENGETR